MLIKHQEDGLPREIFPKEGFDILQPASTRPIGQCRLLWEPEDSPTKVQKEVGDSAECSCQNSMGTEGSPI